MTVARSFGFVEPDDYLQLADEWAQLDNPASQRSAVDRAYYAAFLTARRELTDKGYASFAANSQTHGQVQAVLLEVRPEISQRLSDLRQARNRLTYGTHPTRLPRRQTLAGLLNSAREIIAAVEALPELSEG